MRQWLGASNSANSEHFESLGRPDRAHSIAASPVPHRYLPSGGRAYVEAVAVATQTPPDLAAMLVLAALAAACAKRVVVQVTPDWREPVNALHGDGDGSRGTKERRLPRGDAANHGIRGGGNRAPQADPREAESRRRSWTDPANVAKREAVQHNRGPAKISSSRRRAN